MTTSLKFSIRSNEVAIDRTEGEIIRFLKSHDTETTAIGKQIMVLRELLISRKSFYSDRLSEAEVIINVEIGDEQIVTEVSYPIDKKSDKRLVELDRTIQFIRSFHDPFEPYCMQRIGTYPNRMAEAERWLGLTKIAYEARAVIDFYISEDNMLNISAIRKK